MGLAISSVEVFHAHSFGGRTAAAGVWYRA